MKREPELYSRIEFGWFLGALGIGTAIASALPVWWWLRILIGIVFTFVLLPVLGLIAHLLGRTLRFLLMPVVSLPRSPSNGQSVGVAIGARISKAQQGANPDNPLCSRVIIEYAPGDLHVDTVMPSGTDPRPELRATVERLNRHVESVRAMEGWNEVERWRPNVWSRIKHAWGRAE